MSAIQGHDARAVARTMIDMATAKGLNVTNLTLQKLLYFAHGLCLARSGYPLINEPFQAWKYGPVLESLYHELKIFGPANIRPTDAFIPDWKLLDEEKEAEERKVISDVLDQLGEKDSRYLVHISHLPEGPWGKVYNAATKNIEMTNDDIKQYFKTIVRKQTSN